MIQAKLQISPLTPPISSVTPGCVATSRKLLIVVERQKLVREWLGIWLRSFDYEFDVLCVTDVIRSVEPETLAQAAVVIFGIHLLVPSDPWLTQQMAWIHVNQPDLPIAALGDLDLSHAPPASTMPPGIQGHIPSSSSMDVTMAAIRLIAAGGNYFPPSADGPGPCVPFASSETGDLSCAPLKITPREQAVVALLRNGAPNKVIANHLGMSQSTVKVHVHNIMTKLNARNRTEAAMIVARLGERPEPESARIDGRATLLKPVAHLIPPAA
jgi:DNA-binding NarL/FixJ family response regulator